VWALLAGLAGKGLELLLGLLTRTKDPTAVQLATDKATAETRLDQEQTANEIVDQAAAVRTSADARVLLESEQPAPQTSTGGAGDRTALDADPEGHWRD
jgi:hypothetical protein